MIAGRAQRIFEHAGDADVLLATSPANVAYLLGRELASDAVYGLTMGGTWIAAARSGELRVIAAAIDLPVILEAVARELVVTHDEYSFPAAPPGHPLTEVPRMPRAEQLAAFPGSVLADAATPLVEAAVGAARLRGDPDPFLRARACKDEAELRMLERVNAIAEAALLDALRAVRPGQTEGELTGAIHAGILARGAAPRLCIVGFGERGAIPQDYPSAARALRTGDTIRCDVNCTLDGYNADIARTAVLGPPAPEVAAAYEAILAGTDAAVAALEPGASAAALWRRAADAARGAGLPEYEHRHCGHGIGLAVYEPPILARDGPGELAAGMVLTVETLWLVPGVMGMQIEDGYAVTADGAVRLASGSRELIVIEP